METRAEYNFEGRSGAFGPPFLRGGETRVLAPASSNVCSIPASARAFVLNVTLIARGPVDFVTLWPNGEARPTFWSVRSPDGQIVANQAIVKAGSGAFNIYTSHDTDLLIDITGYFADPVTGGPNLVYYPMTPCRVIETRLDYRSPAGPFGPPTMARNETRRFRFPASPDCPIPPNAAAYSATLTVVPPQPLPFLTLWPSGAAQPNVSSINSFAGRVLANNVIVPAGVNGSVDVYAYDRTDFLVDINGYFAADNGEGLYYTPVVQCRAEDSTTGAIYGDDSTRTVAVPTAGNCQGIPATAKGYVVNVTALPNGSPMPFLTVYPTGQARPNTSVLNAFQGQTVTNSTIVPAGANGAISVYAYRRTNVVVEISGYFAALPRVTSAIEAPPLQSLIGSAGGTIRESDPQQALFGTSIQIPANALAIATTISLQQTSASLPEGYTAVGPGVQFGPNQLNFALPVTLTLRYADTDNDGLVDGTAIGEQDVVVLGSTADGGWEELPPEGRDRTANVVTVAVRHFSTYVAALPTQSLTNWTMAAGDATRWVSDSSPSNAPSSLAQFGIDAAGASDRKTLQITARGNTTDRIKQRSVDRVGPGIYQWRVYIPRFQTGARVGVGAFLYADDHHELDFEVGYGTESERLAAGLTSSLNDKGVLYMTNQDLSAYNCNPPDGGAPKIGCKATRAIAIDLGKWHTFQLSTREFANGTSEAVWSVDGVSKFTVGLLFRLSDFPFHVYCSVEALDFYGAIPATQDTVAYFDTVSYTSSTESSNKSDQGNTPSSTGWTVIGKAPSGPPRLSQTFRSGLAQLNAVEVDIVTGNPGRGGDTLTLRLRDAAGRQLVSVSRTVAEGTNGAVRFSFGQSVAVTPGEQLTLELEDTGKEIFGWKYGGEVRVSGTDVVYPNGMAIFNGQPFQNGLADFSFRTYGSGIFALRLSAGVASTSIPRSSSNTVGLIAAVDNGTAQTQRGVVVQKWLEQGGRTFAAGGALLTPNRWNGDTASLGVVQAGGSVELDPLFHGMGPWGGTGASAGPAVLVVELAIQTATGRWSIVKERVAVTLSP